MSSAPDSRVQLTQPDFVKSARKALDLIATADLPKNLAIALRQAVYRWQLAAAFRVRPRG
jgi:hypothetical protein